MGYFKNIIDHVKEIYTRIKNYLTQPLHNNSGQVVGNRITMIVNDVQTNIRYRCYRFCINKISGIIIIHIITLVNTVVNLAKK